MPEHTAHWGTDERLRLFLILLIAAFFVAYYAWSRTEIYRLEQELGRIRRSPGSVSE